MKESNSPAVTSGTAIVRTADTAEIQKAIIEDKELQRLNARRVEIYSVALPVVVLKDGKAETIWFDETNHPELQELNKMIEFRIEQIIRFYNR